MFTPAFSPDTCCYALVAPPAPAGDALAWLQLTWRALSGNASVYLDSALPSAQPPPPPVPPASETLTELIAKMTLQVKGAMRP